MKTKINDNLESGYLIILFPFLLISLLAVVGLVVDSTNLYSARIKAGAAAEFGVLSAVGSRITENRPGIRNQFNQPTGDSYEETYLKSRFSQSVASNLLANNVIVAGFNNNLQSNNFSTRLKRMTCDVGANNAIDGSRTVSGTVELTVPAFFSPIYKFIGKDSSPGLSTGKVTGFAQTQLEGSAFIFLVDMSSSQSCPSVGPCLCNTANRNLVGTCRQEAGTGSIRIEDIVRSVNKLVTGRINGQGGTPTGLDGVRDRISIIIYNNSAQVLLPFDHARPITGGVVPPGFNPTIAARAISRLVASDRNFPRVDGLSNIIPNGNTNISDALITAREELRRNGLFRPEARMKDRINVVLLSEGAATAMRFNPSNPAMTGANAPAGQDNLTDNLPIPSGDYLNFQLSVQRPGNPPSFAQILGPFVRTLDYKRLVSIKGTPPLRSPMVPQSINAANGYPDNILPNCSLVGGVADPKIFDVDPAQQAIAARRCVGNNFATVGIPDGFNGAAFPTQYAMYTGPQNVTDFRTMYFLAAVKAVGELNDLGAKVFTLSWGELAARETVKLFSLNNVSHVKWYFLANLSNDPYVDDEIATIDPLSNHQFANYLMGYPNNNANNKGFRGKKIRGIPNAAAYRAIDATGFDRLFGQIVLQAKLAILKVH